MGVVVGNIADTLSREEIARFIFGDDSRLSLASEVGRGVAASPSGGVVSLSQLLSYEIVVVVCVVLYICWIFRYTTQHNANTVHQSLFLRGDGTSSENYSELRDIMLSWSLVVALSIILSTRFVDWVNSSDYLPYFSSFNLVGRIIDIGYEMWIMGVAAVFVFSMFWCAAVAYIISFFSRSQHLFLAIMNFRSQMVLLSVLFLLPVILISAFEADDSAVAYLAVFSILTMLWVYLFRSFLLFTSQKISILQWILYLCTVEIFPITLIWAFFTRSSGSIT